MVILYLGVWPSVAPKPMGQKDAVATRTIIHPCETGQLPHHVGSTLDRYSPITCTLTYRSFPLIALKNKNTIGLPRHSLQSHFDIVISIGTNKT